MPPKITQQYEESQYLPIMWFATLIAGPIFEELLFRGFMFKGLTDSFLGWKGAVLLTSLTWSAMHSFTYEINGVIVIFISGILYGVARHRTRSIIIPLQMHIVENFIPSLGILMSS